MTLSFQWISNFKLSVDVLKWGFPGGSAIKNPPANAEAKGDEGLILGWEDPLGEGMAAHSSILAWRVLLTEEAGELQSIGLQRVGHN